MSLTTLELTGCSHQPPIFSGIDQEMNEGLLIGHGYGVTGIKRVTLTGTNLVKLVQAERVNLIRLRDPWATPGWTGKFGRGSGEWKESMATPNVQKKLGLTLDVVNEFWMMFDDFCSNFTNIVTCRTMKHKYSAAISSEWAEPNMAGGSIDNPTTFLSNPQFVFSITEREDEAVICLMQTTSMVKRSNLPRQMGSAGDLPDIISTPPSQLTTGLTSGQPSQITDRSNLPENNPSENKLPFAHSSVHSQQSHTSINPRLTDTDKISLHTGVSETSHLTGTTSNQPPESEVLGPGKLDVFVKAISYISRLGDMAWTIQSHRHRLTVGFSILKVEENRTYRLHRISEVVTTSEFVRTRRVVVRQWLPKGRYVVVATTKQPHEAGTFLLNIYTTHSSGATEMEKDKPAKGKCTCLPFLQQPTLLTQLVVVKATGLEQTRAEPNLYCITNCEGNKVTTPVCKNTLTPEWNTGAVFYRRKPSTPIKVQLWTQNLLGATFLGEVILDGRLEVDEEVVNWPLYDRKDLTQRKPGYLLLRLTVTSNLQGI